MRFGFHISIAGGFSKVRSRAEQLGCETVQLFTRSPRSFRAQPLDPKEVEQFKKDIRESDISPVFVHSPYLVNLAAADRRRADMTREIVVSDAERCALLGVGFLIVHIGRATGSRGALRRSRGESDEPALSVVAENVDRALASFPKGVMLLLENTAGMGSEVGFTFEQIAAVLERISHRDRVGVVLDTAHAFAAGYELRTRAGLDETIRKFDKLVGLSRLYLLHLNDAQAGLGSRIDRHWHIGKGEIGLDGFREIVNHPLLSHLPGIMETPRKSPHDDLANMETIRSIQIAR